VLYLGDYYQKALGVGGWPSFAAIIIIDGCPSFASSAKLGTVDLYSTALCDLPNPPLRAGRQVDHSEQGQLLFTGHTSHCTPTSLLRQTTGMSFQPRFLRGQPSRHHASL
jgi:hypothetical protein